MTVTRAATTSARVATRSPDATLRALALSNAADDSAIALSPPFTAGTTSYTAAVSNEVEQITIAPTTTNNGASVEYLNSSDTEIPDADTTKAGQQVPLAVDATTITVQVTAEDTTTPLPYTVTVTRTPASAQARVTEAEVIEAEVTEAVVTEVRVTSTPQLTSDTYGTGETIEFTVTFSDAVKVEGAPAFRFSLGNAGQTQGVARVAAYDADRSTATKLVFTYEVQASDEDTDGIRVGDHTQTFSLDTNDHITSNNAAAILTHAQLGLLTDHKVDEPGAPPPPPPAKTGTVTDRSGTTTGGGTGGGTGDDSQDDHANTPAQATPVTLDPARTSSTTGQLNPAADVDYFSVDVPHAGAVVVETSGPTATMGTVWQAGAELATANSGGAGRNFRLGARVEAGPVVIALQGQGGATGAYTLQVTFVPGFLENPGANSFQSGIGLISGWTCDADEVEIVLNGEPQEAAYGTARLRYGGGVRRYGQRLWPLVQLEPAGRRRARGGGPGRWSRTRPGDGDGDGDAGGGVSARRDGDVYRRRFPDHGRDGHPGVATDTTELCDCGRSGSCRSQPGRHPRRGVSGESGAELVSEWHRGDFGLGV